MFKHHEKQSRTTRRTLVFSILILLLCLAMLIGLTFAWFTSQAHGTVADITTGTLIVTLDCKTGDEEASLTWDLTEGQNSPYRWEPNATNDLSDVTIANKGSLALKYKLAISGGETQKVTKDENGNEVKSDTTVDLTKALTFTATLTKADGTTETVTFDSGNESADSYSLGVEESDTLTVTAHMKETAGNEYQSLTLSGLTLTVYATQDTVEKDKTGDQYDKDATFPTAKPADAKTVTISSAVTDTEKTSSVADAISNSAGAKTEITLPANTTINSSALTTDGKTAADVTIKGDPNHVDDTVIDMSNEVKSPGATYTFENVTLTSDQDNYEGIQHAEEVTYINCKFVGKQFLYANKVTLTDCTFTNMSDYSIWTYGSKDVTFSNCSFISGGRAVLIYNETGASFTGNYTFTNCSFSSDGSDRTGKGAIEFAYLNKDNVQTYVAAINNCTQHGFAVNNSDNALYGNKDNMDADHLQVTIDGVRVSPAPTETRNS